MCTAAINLTSKALDDVNNAEVLLDIKRFISLFIQSMEVRFSSLYPDCTERTSLLQKGWGYSVATLDAFFLELFDRYAGLLKRRFSEDFQDVSILPIPTTCAQGS